MRKKKLTVLIFVSLAFLLTACGRQGSGKETAVEEPLKIETEAGNTRKEETQTPSDGTEKPAPGTDMQEQEGKVRETDAGDDEVKGRFEIFEVTQE